MNPQLTLDVGPAPVEELLERFESNHGSYLSGCRAVLYVLAQEQGEVCADDYWRMVEAGEIPPLPDGVSSNVLGGLFRDERFRPVGHTRSQRPSSNGNILTTWEAVA